MSRAFVFEKDDMFHCEKKNKDCQHANLRGGCDLIKCKDEDSIKTPNEFIALAENKTEESQ